MWTAQWMSVQLQLPDSQLKVFPQSNDSLSFRSVYCFQCCPSCPTSPPSSPQAFGHAVYMQHALLVWTISTNLQMESSSIFKMGILGWSVLNVSMYVCTRSSHLLPPLMPCEVVGQHTTDGYTTFHLKLSYVIFLVSNSFHSFKQCSISSNLQHLSSAKCVLFTIHNLHSTC